MNRDLSTVAWDIAKGQNLAGRVNFKLTSQLTDLYGSQARILKLEDEIAGVFLNRESRNPANVHLTLILLRDNYKGWAYDRGLALIKLYGTAIAAIDKQISE